MEPTTFPAGLIALAICWTLTRPAERQLITRAARRSWPVFRPAIGWACLFLGVLGVILPVLQGVLFLVIGAALVGPRHPLIRRVRAGYKLLLRRLAGSPNRLVAWLGGAAQRAQRAMSIQTRHFQRRRHELAIARRRFRVALVPPAEICQELNRWRRLYDPAYYVDLPPHILLVAASRSLHRERIEQRLAALCAAFPAFEIELAGVGLHEDEHRLICQIGAGSRQLALLRDQLAALEHPPLRIARRRCWPGITLAKLRRQRSLREAHASVCAGFAPGAWTAEGLVLFEERFGAAWHSVRVFPFAVRPSP